MKNPVNMLWPAGTPPAVDFRDEAARAGVIRSYAVEELEHDPELQDIVRFAGELADVPIVLVSIVEEDRQFFVAREGLGERETPRCVSFCAHAMLLGEGMTVEDARAEDRFADNALVTGAPHIRFYHGQPLVSSEGAPLGALCFISPEPRPGGLAPLQKQGAIVLAQAVMRRLEARRADIASVTAIAAEEDRFRMLSDNIPDIAWSCTPDFEFDFYNAKWREVTGLEPPRQADGWRAVVHPDDQANVFGKWEEAGSAGSEFESEYRMRHADGGWRWVLSRATPIRDEAGAIERWFGTVTEIDDQYRLSQSRDLLAKELSHRIKNIFAVITGLIALSVRKTPEHKPFADELSHTLRALGRAHDYVRPTGEDDTDRETLQGLFSDLFAPYGGGEHARVKVRGDDLPIGPRAATPLALIFHELATNSAKYGALATDDGTVDVVLRDTGERVEINWIEHGMLRQPDLEHEGFGSRLVDMSVRGQLEGSWTREFGRDGLVITLDLARSALVGEKA